MVNAVTEGSATVGILPFPNDSQATPWWPRLLHGNGPSIVARLPFAPLPSRSAETDDALVIAMMRAEPSGDDRSFVALRTGSANSRGRINDAFKNQAFEPTMMLSQDDTSDPDVAMFFVEFDGFIEPEDPSIDALLADLDGPAPRIWVLGAYAKQFTRDALGGTRGAGGAARA